MSNRSLDLISKVVSKFQNKVGLNWCVDGQSVLLQVFYNILYSSEIMRFNALSVVVLFSLFLAPNTSAAELSIADGYVDEVLGYEDELLVSVKDPTALPLKISNYGDNLRSFKHDYLGEIYTNGWRLIDSDGDEIEINGKTENLVNLNDNFAVFGDGTYYSFREGNQYNLTEQVSSESNLSGSCPEKWIFLDTCFSPINYYYKNSGLDDFIFVKNSYVVRTYIDSYFYYEEETIETSFVYDLERRELVISGNIHFLGYNQKPTQDYVLIDDIDQNQLIILDKDGTMTNTSRHSEEADANENNYQNSNHDFCFSNDFIFGHFRDYSGNYQHTSFFIERSNGHKTNLSQISLQQNLSSYELNSYDCVHNPTKTHILVNQIPYTLSAFHDLILSNNITEHQQIKQRISCSSNAVGSTYQENTYVTIEQNRFLQCSENEPSEQYRLYFDLDTGNYLYMPYSHIPRFVYGDLVLIEGDNCFLWDTNGETIKPIIHFSDSYWCRTIFVYDGNVYLNHQLSLAPFTSDGRIDLDNSMVYSEDNNALRSFTSFVETTYESSFFTVFVSLILVSVIYMNKRKFQNVLDEFESETSMKIEALERELTRIGDASGTFPRSDINAPSIDSNGHPDNNGFEWFTTEDGRNWYRSQGSNEEWVEFSN